MLSTLTSKGQVTIPQALRPLQLVGAVHGATLTRTLQTLQDMFAPARESKQEHEMSCGC